MKSAGTWNVALGVAVVWLVVLVVVMAVLIGPVQDAEKDHFTSFAPTTVMVVASGKAKYRCADVFNCQCAEVPTAPTCGDINHEGVCSYVVAEPERCQRVSTHGACLDCFRAGSYCCRCELIQLVMVVAFCVSLHVCMCACVYVCVSVGVTCARVHAGHNCVTPGCYFRVERCVVRRTMFALTRGSTSHVTPCV